LQYLGFQQAFNLMLLHFLDESVAERTALPKTGACFQTVVLDNVPELFGRAFALYAVDVLESRESLSGVASGEDYTVSPASHLLQLSKRNRG
jgi:hypothetical protein